MDEWKSDWEMFVDENNEMLSLLLEMGWDENILMVNIFCDWRAYRIAHMLDDGIIDVDEDNFYVKDNATGHKYDVSKYKIHTYIGALMNDTIH